MGDLFLSLFNRSVAAGWLILAVAALRLVLKKAPKALHCLLWLLVGVRLACPFSIESALSLIPSAEVIRPSATGGSFQITTGIAAVNSAVNPYLADRSVGITAQAGLRERAVQICAVVWLIGAAALLLCSLVSYLRLRRRVSTAVRLRGSLWQSDQIASPFLLGFFRPRIYIPFGMDASSLAYVEAHEQAHIRRRDHWWKPIGFLILAVYWFNPLVWAAYILLCRDIELACDERVVGTLGEDCKRPYSEALLQCGVSRRNIAACPLAFGEVGIKRRVKNILTYKRPALWVIAASLAVCAAVAVCFLTDPAASSASLPQDEAVITSLFSNAPPPTWTDRETLENLAEVLRELSYQELGASAEMRLPLELRLTYDGETRTLTAGQNGIGTVDGAEGLVSFDDPGLYHSLWYLYSRKTGCTVRTGGALLFQSAALSSLPVDGGDYAGVIEDGGALTITGRDGAAIFTGSLESGASYTRKEFLFLFDSIPVTNPEKLEEMVPEDVEAVTARVYRRTGAAGGAETFTIWEPASDSGESKMWLGLGGETPGRLFELLDLSAVFPCGGSGLLWTYAPLGSSLLPIRFDGAFQSVEVWTESGAVSPLPPRDSKPYGIPSGSSSLPLGPGDTAYWAPAADGVIPERSILFFRFQMADGTTLEDHVELRPVSDQVSLYGFQTCGLSIDWLGMASSQFHLCALAADEETGVCVVSPSSAGSSSSFGAAAVKGQGVPPETEEAAP